MCITYVLLLAVCEQFLDPFFSHSQHHSIAHSANRNLASTYDRNITRGEIPYI